MMLDAVLVEELARRSSRGSMTTIRLLSNLKWRSISGSVPRPIEPKPIITIGAGDFAVNGPVFIRHFIEHSFRQRLAAAVWPRRDKP